MPLCGAAEHHKLPQRKAARNPSGSTCSVRPLGYSRHVGVSAKEEELASSAMSAPCFLVAHPKGTLMWDTGPVADSSFKDGVGTLRYAATTKRTLTSQLAQVGYAFRHHVSRALAFPLGSRGKRESVRRLYLAYAQSRTRHHVHGPAVHAHRAAELQRSEEQQRPCTSPPPTTTCSATKPSLSRLRPDIQPGHQVLFLKLAQTGPGWCIRRAICIIIPRSGSEGWCPPPNSMRTKPSLPVSPSKSS